MWTKLDDGFCENPKVVSVGPLAGWLHVMALLYCGRNLTDGFIPASMAPRLADWRNVVETHGPVCPLKLAKRLEDAGLWVFQADRCGWVVHDYLKYQPSKAQVLSDRAQRHKQKAAAGRKGGQKTQAKRRLSDTKQKPSRPQADRKQTTKQNQSPVPVPVTVSKETVGDESPGTIDPRAIKLRTWIRERPALAAIIEPLAIAERTVGKLDAAGRSDVDPRTIKAALDRVVDVAVAKRAAGHDIDGGALGRMIIAWGSNPRSLPRSTDPNALVRFTLER